LELGQKITVKRNDKGEQIVRWKNDPLLLAIIGTAILLMIVVGVIAAFWGSDYVLAKAPFYVPLISAFIALTTLSVSYLALGRYQVLRDPLSFWVGNGFATYAIGQIFVVLTWPGLLPGDASILGHSANTSTWIGILDLVLIDAFLLLSTILRWPNQTSAIKERWIWIVVAWQLLVTAGFVSVVLGEAQLVPFIGEDGQFTLPARMLMSLLLIVFLAGSILSVRHYYQRKDRLAGFVAFPQLALAFVCMIVLIGGRRYDLWWYVQRAVLMFGHLVLFFGLLSEYVRLLQRESEGSRMLEAILANIPIGLAVTGGPPHFTINQVSRYGLDMNQRSAEQLLGSPSAENQVDWRIFLPDGVTQAAQEQMPLYRASHLGEEIRNVEMIMEAQDGRRISVLVNAAPIRDAQGNIVAAINTWLDITDRKRVEKSLEEKESLYRSIARSIPNSGIFVVDKNMRYIIAEGPVSEKFGYTREMFEGHTFQEIFKPEAAAKMEARFRRVTAGETISYETERNGRIYWTQQAPLDDALGHSIIVTLDITERKKVERALSESEQRLRAVLNQATAGIIRSDTEGKSVFVNQAFCEMLGFRESDLLGKTLWPFTDRDDIEENRRLYDLMMERATPFELEKRFVRRNGSILWVNVSAAPILDEVGRPQSSVSVVIDITERKKAEEELQRLNVELENRVEDRTAELRSANKALLESRGRLQVLSQRLVEVQEQERHALARELHDRVGQSLTALNLNLTIINDQLSNSKTQVNSRLVDSIKLVSEMIAIVRDVMSDLRPVVLDEYGLVAALQAYIGKFENRYGIKVDFSRSHPVIPRVGAAMEMTVLRIAQEALLNIARHAQASQVSLSLKCEENAMLLMIEDNGIGISSSDNANHSDGHGLMIMRERAEAVGGSLTISSASGKGTRIEAILPFQQNSKIKA
jgi:PAS domain S-box-containing protein